MSYRRLCLPLKIQFPYFFESVWDELQIYIYCGFCMSAQTQSQSSSLPAASAISTPFVAFCAVSDRSRVASVSSPTHLLHIGLASSRGTPVFRMRVGRLRLGKVVQAALNTGESAFRMLQRSTHTQGDDLRTYAPPPLKFRSRC